MKNNSKTSQLGSSSISSSHDLIDAKLEEHQQLCASKHCPSCGHKLEGKPVHTHTHTAGCVYSSTSLM